MNAVIELTDREVIAASLTQNVALNIYQIGDLDDFFWPQTKWWGLQTADGLRAIALLYGATATPTLIMLEDNNRAECRSLLANLLPLLPGSLYAHVSPSLAFDFEAAFGVTPHGTHLKMHLRAPERASAVTSSGVRNLTIEDTQELEDFYREAYPGNWFDSRMLATGQYFGVCAHGRIMAAGGVHVYSERYRVAALGNIATLPERRGEGLAGIVTAAIIRSLMTTVTHVGLNVKADNHAAIACYRKLGFVEIARYHELSLIKRRE